MHKNATKCNKTQSKWCINKHGASKIIDTFETYHTGCLWGASGDALSEGDSKLTGKHTKSEIIKDKGGNAPG
jgi:hypothetical protein